MHFLLPCLPISQQLCLPLHYVCQLASELVSTVGRKISSVITKTVAEVRQWAALFHPSDSSHSCNAASSTNVLWLAAIVSTFCAHEENEAKRVLRVVRKSNYPLVFTSPSQRKPPKESIKCTYFWRTGTRMLKLKTRISQWSHNLGSFLIPLHWPLSHVWIPTSSFESARVRMRRIRDLPFFGHKNHHFLCLGSYQFLVNSPSARILAVLLFFAFCVDLFIRQNWQKYMESWIRRLLVLLDSSSSNQSAYTTLMLRVLGVICVYWHNKPQF